VSNFSAAPARCYITSAVGLALAMVSLNSTITPAQAGKALKVANMDGASGDWETYAYAGERHRGA
jgi:hypothetical protein